MKYAITEDKKIHQVTNEKEFYKHNPKAQDISKLPNVYKKFLEQEKRKPNEVESLEGLNRLGVLSKEGKEHLRELKEE